MKTVRIACLLALALPLLAASTGQAQYNNSWGPHPAYPKPSPKKPANYKKTAFRRNTTTRSANSHHSGCDAGCTTGCDAGCDTAPPVDCDTAPPVGCDTVPDCGCDVVGRGCHKVCRLVKVEVAIETTCYGVKCKETCVPGCGSKCFETDCVQCGGAGCDYCGSGATCQIRYPAGKPGRCACVKTIKHLVKYKMTEKVCGYRWAVVEAGCGGCDACGCDTGFDSAPATEKSEGDPFRDDFPPIPIPQDPNA